MIKNKVVLDKHDKEILYEYLWKLINFIYGVAIMISIFFGIRILIYFLGGIKDEEMSDKGIIKLCLVIISFIIFRNLIKPFLFNKMNRNK